MRYARLRLRRDRETYVQYEATGESEYQAVLLTAPGSPLAFLRAQGQLIPESILDCALSLRE